MPSASTWSTASIKVKTTSPGEGRILKKHGDSVGFDLGRQGPLGRGIRLSIDTGTRGDGSTKGALGGSQAALLGWKADQIAVQRSRQAEKLPT